MTPGSMSDMEAEEVFVVLADARTVWSVTESLRKVYVTPLVQESAQAAG